MSTSTSTNTDGRALHANYQLNEASDQDTHSFVRFQ